MQYISSIFITCTTLIILKIVFLFFLISFIPCFYLLSRHCSQLKQVDLSLSLSPPKKRPSLFFPHDIPYSPPLSLLEVGSLFCHPLATTTDFSPPPPPPTITPFNQFEVYSPSPQLICYFTLLICEFF